MEVTNVTMNNTPAIRAVLLCAGSAGRVSTAVGDRSGEVMDIPAPASRRRGPLGVGIGR
jgi:hypothetical protein